MRLKSPPASAGVLVWMTGALAPSFKEEPADRDCSHPVDAKATTTHSKAARRVRCLGIILLPACTSPKQIVCPDEICQQHQATEYTYGGQKGAHHVLHLFRSRMLTGKSAHHAGGGEEDHHSEQSQIMYPKMHLHQAKAIYRTLDQPRHDIIHGSKYRHLDPAL